MKTLILLFLPALLFAQTAVYNPFTRKIDYLGAAGATTLAELTDVSTTGAASMDWLVFNGTTWVKRTPAGGPTGCLDFTTSYTPDFVTSCLTSLAWTWTGYHNFSGGSVRLPESVYASLPSAAANTGKVYLVTDGATAACAAGGGSTACLVRSSGSAWVLLGGSASARTIEHIAAISQAGAAASGFSMVATANAYPTPTAVTGSNAVGAVLSFSDSYTQSVQQRFVITGTTISADIWWRANVANASLNAVWQLQTACVAADEDGDPAWNTVQTVTSAAHGTAYRWRKATISSVTVTGCATNEVMRYNLYRDPTHASDTLAAAAELISVVWTVQ